MYDDQDTKQTCDLSRELRAYNANGNAIGAERMMARAADALDITIEALKHYAEHPSLMTGERVAAYVALLKMEEV